MSKKYQPPLDENGSISFDPTHKFTVKRTGKQVMRLQMAIRITAIVVLALFLLVLLLYLFSFFSTQAGRFTVRNKDLKYGLILSETADFAKTSGELFADAVENMDNITYEWLPTNLNDVDGSHNDRNYLAYTFYVKNTGSIDITYDAQINLEYVKKNADEAVRVELFKNGEPTVYAKSTPDGNAEVDPVWGATVPFVDATTVMTMTRDQFLVDQVDKYTVVIWMEGWDPECVDDILGGEIKMSMDFSVRDPDEAESV